MITRKGILDGAAWSDLPLTLAVVLLSLRGYSTLTSKSVLGSSEYGMFARGHREIVRGFPMVELLQSDGSTTELLHPRSLLPIEAGHALNCFAAVFFGHDSAAKARLADVVVSRLNKGHWPARGERWPSPSRIPGVHYIGMRVISATIDLRPLALGSSEVVTPSTVVFDWRSDG